MSTPEVARRGNRPAAPARHACAPEVLEIARRSALRLGLAAEDAEDCALAFVGRVLADGGEAALRPPGHSPGDYCPRWVWRCAFNHARDFHGAQARRGRWERPWPAPVAEDGECEAWDRAADLPGPEALALRAEVWRAVEDGLARLAPEPRALFLGHHVDGLTVLELAVSCGRTPHAVEQALTRSRHRLRALLERRGLTEREARLHFAPPP